MGRYPPHFSTAVYNSSPLVLIGVVNDCFFIFTSVFSRSYFLSWNSINLFSTRRSSSFQSLSCMTIRSSLPADSITTE